MNHEHPRIPDLHPRRSHHPVPGGGDPVIRHLVALLPPLAAVIGLVAYHEGKQQGLRDCPGKPLSVVFDGRVKVCVYTQETLHHKPVRKELT